MKTLDFVIKNCSSPGASFTENTNNVILCCYDWINKNKNKILPFIKFRKKISEEYGFNENNARNILPLLKNCDFIKYEKGKDIDVNNFFTKKGLAYSKFLHILKDINTSEYSNNTKEKAIKKIETCISELIYEGLSILLKNTEINYRDVFISYIKYITVFKRINKFEFAYMLYELQNDPTCDITSKMFKIITMYRSKQIDFNISVNVRNDIDMREKQNENSRLENINFLSSFNYFSSLLVQARLISKDDNDKGYYVIIDDNKIRLQNIISEVKK